MDGFEGLDIVRAGEEIQAFYNEAMNGYGTVSNACKNFFSDLSNNWASPKAIDFSKKYTAKFSEILEKFITAVNRITQGAREAGTTLAVANGATFNVDIPVSININANGAAAFPLCKETLNGATGMQVSNVRQIREKFEVDINSAISTIRNIDDKIDFYSADGSLLDTYSTNIRDFADQIDDTFKDASKELNTYMESEENVILQAKQEANEAMQ